MSKLSLVSKAEGLSYFNEEQFLATSVERNKSFSSLPTQLNAQKCSVEELLFVLKNSLEELKTSQGQVSFLTEELGLLMKKP